MHLGCLIMMTQHQVYVPHQYYSTKIALEGTKTSCCELMFTPHWNWAAESLVMYEVSCLGLDLLTELRKIVVKNIWWDRWETDSHEEGRLSQVEEIWFILAKLHNCDPAEKEMGHDKKNWRMNHEFVDVTDTYHKIVTRKTSKKTQNVNRKHQ